MLTNPDRVQADLLGIRVIDEDVDAVRCYSPRRQHVRGLETARGRRNAIGTTLPLGAAEKQHRERAVIEQVTPSSRTHPVLVRKVGLLGPFLQPAGHLADILAVLLDCEWDSGCHFLVVDVEVVVHEHVAHPRRRQ